MFWDVFENLCKQVGKKPSPVGKEIGVSAMTVSRWKEGVIPSGETLMKIADYFSVSTDYLLGRTDEPTVTIGSGNVNGDNSIQTINPVTNYNAPSENQNNDALNDPLTQKFLNAFINLDLDKQVEIMRFTLEQAKKGA